jgi:hypothetical protein
MAELVPVAGYAHTPYLFGPPSMWPRIRDRIRKGKPIRDDLPRETDAELVEKYERSMKAFTGLRQWIEAVRPDVLLVIGDDQQKVFKDYVAPFAIYTGRDVASKKLPGRVREVTGNEDMVHVPNHVELAREIADSLKN